MHTFPFAPAQTRYNISDCTMESKAKTRETLYLLLPQ